MNSIDRLDWSLIRAVLAVAEAGSLSGAARETGVSQPTLGRLVRAAEMALGVTIFRRHARGLELTQAGAALMIPAREMKAAAAKLGLAAAGHDTRLTGTVRITASVVISHHVLPAILAELRAEEPGIQIELHPSDTSDNLLFGEADIALRMYRPEQLETVTRYLGDIPLGFFAARNYLDRVGRPVTEQSLFQLDWVGLDRSDLLIRGMRDMGYSVTRDFFAMRCDDAGAHLNLIRAGCGLGIVQTQIALGDPALEQVMPDFALPKLPLWLTAHEALHRTPRIRRVWEVLADRLPAAAGAVL